MKIQLTDDELCTMSIMKASYIFLVILVYGSNIVSCKRKTPRHDEIERVINETYSVIWKCSVSECHPGSGLSFLCGTRIPFSESIECVYCVKGVNFSDTNDYSQCKSCRKCSPHEKSSGHCTTTEDTTRCLKICDKGFYWNKITDSCDPCSDCCEQPSTHHEKQCEDSGLPVSHQCRQTHVKCQHRMVSIKTPELVHNDEQNGVSSSSITGIIVGCVLMALIVLGFVFWKKWHLVKAILKSCCCFSQGKANTIYFLPNPEDEEADLESGPCLPVNGSASDVHLGEVYKKGLLTSGVPGASRPGYYRGLSVPPESRSDSPKAKTAFLRSKSHPGCVKDDPNEGTLKENGLNSPKKCHSSWREKKFAKKGYIAVPTDSDLPDVTFEGTADTPRENKPKNQRSFTVGQQHQSTSTTGLDCIQHTTTTIASVPEHFQNNLLTRKMEKIPNKFYSKICIKLDKLRDCFWDDYRSLGEAIGLEKDVVSYLAQIGNPTCQMLEKFDSQEGSSIRKFRDIVKEMGRDDVVSIVKEWIVDEWIKSNYSLSQM